MSQAGQSKDLNDRLSIETSDNDPDPEIESRADLGNDYLSEVSSFLGNNDSLENYPIEHPVSESASSNSTFLDLTEFIHSPDSLDIVPSERNINSNLSPEDLTTYLKKDMHGLAIITTYEKTGVLTPGLRTLLVHKVIDRAISKKLQGTDLNQTEYRSLKISKTEFLALREEIIAIFPTEHAEVYYTPFTQVNGFRTLATGKLWDHFNYVKAKFKACFSSSKSNDTNDNESSDHPVLTDDEKNCLSELTDKIEPWDDVVRLWQSSFKLRRLKFQDENTTIAQYFHEYKCLQLERGQNLLMYDFEQIHPEKSNCLISKWEKLRTVIIPLLQGKYKTKDVDALVHIRLLTNLPPAQQDSLLLYLLPHLIKPSSMVMKPPPKKRRIAQSSNIAQKPCRPSIKESQDAFILHVQNAIELDSVLHEKTTGAGASDVSSHPMCVFVGELTNIESTYVIVNNTRYRTQTPLEAVDLAFKAFFALDCQYPCAGFQIWQLLQKIVYEISTPFDRLSTATKVLIGEITDGLRRN